MGSLMENKQATDKKNLGNVNNVSNLFWENQLATIAGMLDNFTEIHEIDLSNSQDFLIALRQHPKICTDKFLCGLDAGCGIGRVTSILAPLCNEIDLLESVSKHLQVAMDNIKYTNSYHSNLQNFEPIANRYDIIWIQWVVQYLSDDELLNFLVKMKNGLKYNSIGDSSSVICIKENIELHDVDEYDERDGSIIRSVSKYLSIFKEAKYECILEMDQTFLPSSFKPIKTFAIIPIFSSDL
ncbi:uncharacterized protein CMU_008770 [Cryptosporidium muris RN66]|uniref:Alpha N-terminal protein methyltransferase 1 n=1 Tax=Cryptosporidium muris (strain RN66) TaxID=441375 RepID=B6ADU5_CRYMR|nr:uncharacterized protein CMU_008770 [Cryptosporidium muris RN66]EEA06386.1 hypothetical protein, conserved [Cryptosporidium muris RN66]|eukprot:XP_002140735.1 hypothetical protein [Cryptosporidium muris RN66]